MEKVYVLVTIHFLKISLITTHNQLKVVLKLDCTQNVHEPGQLRKKLFQLVPQSSQTLVKTTANNTSQCIQNFKLSDNELK